MHILTNEEAPLFDYLTSKLHINISESQLPINISCPLHKDQKPSLRLYAPKERGGYCFSCGKAYSAVSLHSALYGCGVWEANVEVAELFGIEIGDDKSEIKGKDYISLVKVKRGLYKIVRCDKEARKKLFRKVDKWLSDKDISLL